MKVQILKTTDGLNVGKIFDVPVINYDVCSELGMHPDSITWIGNVCLIQNSNYTIKLIKTGQNNG